MVFSSLEFLFIFLPLTLIFYFLMPKSMRNVVLVGASLIFYAWGEPIYIGIMLFSTVFDYFNGLMIDYFYHLKKQKQATMILILSLVGNLGILLFFKYSDFMIQNVNELFHLNFELLELALPIGISFYTFQTLSYTIDVYRGVVQAQRNIIDFATYVTMFPQLVAGPIVQYKDVEGQLENRVIDVDSFAYGIERFVYGLAKKVLLANNMGLLWEQISSSNLASLSILGAWLGAIAFAFQIYFDFSGYSDMAIGLGQMFGFHFLENFNLPYCSKSVTEFWRRWHISLGNWFKEYVYFPLGGSRCSWVKMIRNIFVVWFLTGLWHGASWNFVCWGLYFGILLMLEKSFFLKVLKKLPSWMSQFITFVLVCVSWIIFAFVDLHEGLIYLKSCFGFNGNPIMNQEVFYLFHQYGFILICCLVLSFGWFSKIQLPKLNHTIKSILKILCLFVLMGLSISFLVGDTYNPFLYFRF